MRHVRGDTAFLLKVSATPRVSKSTDMIDAHNTDGAQN